MNRYVISFQPKMAQQTGAALIVSLMLLVILTMLGISAMEATKLQTKMALNTAEVNRALQTAEYAVAVAQKELSERVFKGSPTDFSSADDPKADAEGFLELSLDEGADKKRLSRYRYDGGQASDGTELKIQGPFLGRTLGNLRLYHYYVVATGCSQPAGETGCADSAGTVKLKVGWAVKGPKGN